MNITEIVRRSSLIMPVNQPRFVDKAYLRGADAIVLDLEDSVPPAEKGRARTVVKGAIPVAARGGADVFVRINKPLEMTVEDLEAAIHPGLTGLALPKVESAAEIHMLDELTTYWERRHGVPQGTVQFSVSVETARGVMRAEEIAAASPRIASIGAGPEDLALDLGIEATVEGTELLYIKLRMIAWPAAPRRPIASVSGGPGSSTRCRCRSATRPMHRRRSKSNGRNGSSRRLKKALPVARRPSLWTGG
jgi:citrate lyase subunit beta / citryl-CoA lyase